MPAVADAADECRDRGLIWQIEAVERLVEQQQLRATNERLGDQESLLLAARELADRLAGVAFGAHELEYFRDSLARRLSAREAGKRQSPPGSLESEPDDVDAADAGAGVEVASLRQVADPAVFLTRRPPQHGGASGGEGQQAEHGLDQRRLAGPVRTEDRDELAVCDRE